MIDILLIDPLEPEVVDWLEARHSVRAAPALRTETAELHRALGDVRCLIAPPSVAIDRALLIAAPHLIAVGHRGGDNDHVDLASCSRAGVSVFAAPNAAAAAESEFMVGALLQMLRRVPVLNAEGLLVGRELGGIRVGLIGMTPTMRPLARLLGAFGAHVVGYHPSLHASDPLWARWRIEPAGLRELFEACDAVCVMLPYYSRFRGLIGERFLPLCKPNQVLVSIADAKLFDESSLADALRSGRMAAAWFDRADASTLSSEQPWSDLPMIQFTPGVAATTLDSRQRASWTVAHRVHEALGGIADRAEFKPTERDVPLDFAAEESPD